jgi:phosphatidylglycerophosphate synthase
MRGDGWLIFENGKWRQTALDPAAPCTRWPDLRYYYPNFIDYARIAMCLLAAMTLSFHQFLATAILIIGSTLLDWVDGPVARAHDQCTIFGSGLDWLADILAQIVTMVWLVSLAPALLPALMLVTAIELTNCIFDFGTTATGRYPILDRQGGFRIILDWSLPHGSYTVLGTAAWLAYPLFTVACCLDLSWPVRSQLTGGVLGASEVLLSVPALLYVWCELAYAMFIIGKWREAPRKAAPVSYDDGAVQSLRELADSECDLLRVAWSQGVQRFASEWQASIDRKLYFGSTCGSARAAGRKQPSTASRHWTAGAASLCRCITTRPSSNWTAMA